jgi:rod shape-determining protein MreD
MNSYVAGAVLFITALLQTQFLPAFLPGVNQYVPDLVLLVIVSWALLLEWRWSMSVAFLAGLLLDLLNPTYYPIGVNALLFVVVVLAAGFLGHDPFRSGVIRSVPVALVAAAGYRLARLLIERMLGYNNFQVAIIIQVILPVIIIDGALMIVVFGFIRALSRIRAPQQ